MRGAVDALVHRWEPPAQGGASVLVLHGRGGSEHDLIAAARAIAPGAGVLAPRGPESQPPGWAWFAHRAIGVPVEESFDARLAEVAGWLAAAVAAYRIAPPMPVIGFSNGGMMAGALVAVHPDLVDRAVLMASGYPLPAHIAASGGLAGRRILICGGDEDPFHPPATMSAGARAYAAAGARVDAWSYPATGHTITLDQARDAAQWLADSDGSGGGRG